MSPQRFWLAFAILFLLSVPMRLAWMNESLWLDEAWVVNSVLEPAWGKMFHYDSWVQSSPPLFLALMRIVMSVTGPNECSARLVPWIAAAIAPVFVAAALRRLVTPGAALAGTAFLLSSYWSIKFAQQAKQYGTDMLAASIALWLMTRWMEEERPPWLLAVTAGFAVGTPWLSFPSVFFLPPLLLTVRPWTTAVPIAAMVGLSCTLDYVFAVEPARTPWMIRNWRRHMLNPSQPAGSFKLLALNLANLTIPQVFRGASLLAAAIALVLGAGLVAAQRRRDLLMLAAPPLSIAVVASFLGLYPMTGQVRMIMWLLPCLAIPVAVAAEWLPRKSIVVLCAATVIAGQWVLMRASHHNENNREAVSAIRTEFAPDDCLFVQAGVAEQFKYYSAQRGWTPSCRFTGKYSTPCCPAQWPDNNRDASRFHAELAAARTHLRGNRLWIFSPEPEAGQWMGGLRTILAEIPARMAEAGCALEWERGFDRSKVQRYRCSR